jgi:1-deoxy-D-xylulose 5-phosphate reductoisomerase
MEATLFFPFLSSINFFFQVARHPDAATVVTGIVGCAGLKVTSDYVSFTLSSYVTNMAKFTILLLQVYVVNAVQREG